VSLLIDRIKDDMKASMKAGNKARLGVIRMILAAIKQVEVDERIELDDGRVIVILDKMLKQRRESIKQFRDANRVDLAEIEEAEVTVIHSEAEIDEMVAKAITEVGASSIKDMGTVMALLKPQMQGRADMAVVSARIKAGFVAT
jgi:uncharacterized protein YqeY